MPEHGISEPFPVASAIPPPLPPLTRRARFWVSDKSLAKQGNTGFQKSPNVVRHEVHLMKKIDLGVPQCLRRHTTVKGACVAGERWRGSEHARLPSDRLEVEAVSGGFGTPSQSLTRAALSVSPFVPPETGSTHDRV
jgi:hypothetical protein